MNRHVARLFALASLCLLATRVSAADHSPPPLRIDPLVEQFMQATSFWHPTLSPDGKHMAVIAVSNAESHLMMMDTATLNATVIASAPNATSRDDPHRLSGSPLAIFWLGDDLVGVNLGGDRSVSLALDGTVVQRLLGPIKSVLLDDRGRATDWVLLQDFNPARWLDRVNVRTGESFVYDLDVPGWNVRMLFDTHGEPMLATVSNSAVWTGKTTIATWYRDSKAAPWRKIDERPALFNDFQPVAIPTRAGHLLVRARNGSDRFAVWDYDIDKRAFGEALAASETDDVIGGDIQFGTGDIADYVTEGLKQRVTWLDSQKSRLQALLDQALPGRVNLLKGPTDRLMLVDSFSDVDPGTIFTFDPAKLTLRKVLSLRPAIDPDRMQPMQTLHYASADGTQIPAYLTLPGKPSKPVPLIVLIHGGPIARDHWQWDQDVQLFAAHGYAVFQPQFRGSSGFGEKFERAGYQQVGLAMQDDVTAGVQAMIDLKIADPQRICIVGTSYGGYAALWGLETTPDLYRCGVSTSGPSDIEAEVTSESAGSKSNDVLDVWNATIGEPKAMHAIWASVSPRLHADRIKAPLLLVHGEADEVVPLSHGEKMLDAMTSRHKDVEWLDFPAEAHGVTLLVDQRIWFGAMLELFARTIGEGEAPVAPTAGMIRRASELADKNKQAVWLPREKSAPPAPSAAPASAH